MKHLNQNRNTVEQFVAIRRFTLQFRQLIFQFHVEERILYFGFQTLALGSDAEQCHATQIFFLIGIGLGEDYVHGLEEIIWRNESIFINESKNERLESCERKKREIEKILRQMRDVTVEKDKNL